MPRLKIDGKRAFAFAPPLVDITCRVIEYSQHRNDAIGSPIGSADIRARGAHIMNAEPDPSSRLRNFGTLFQGVKDAFDAVLFDLKQKAGGHLRDAASLH